MRAEVGEKFIIMFRLSMLDLVEEASDMEEVLILAKELEKAGVTLINTGIGWHEARVPTIVTSVPRAAFADVTAKVKAAVNVPVVASTALTCRIPPKRFCLPAKPTWSPWRGRCWLTRTG